MGEFDQQRVGGFPVLILIGLATVLAWAFGNPFVGWMIIFAIGMAGLALFEYVRQHWKHHP